MKKFMHIGCFLFTSLLYAQTSSSKIVEYPIVGATNTSSVQIAKVELTPEATILHIDAFYRPKYWIRIDSKTYLLADGKKYTVTNGEGVELDQKFWMPESGSASFILRFPPLPKETKSFDFIESDCEDCFKIYNVDLTGQKEYPQYPKGLPIEFQKKYKDGTLPAFQFKTGTTKLKFHILGYKKGMTNELTLYLNTLVNGQNEEVVIINEDGMGKLEFQQYGSVSVSITQSRGLVGRIWLAPGEELDVYVDMQEMARSSINRNLKKSFTPRMTVYSNGVYSNLNHFLQVMPQSKYRGLNLYSGNFADYRMTADQYMAHLTTKYDSICKEIAADKELSRMAKEFFTVSLQQELFDAATSGSYLLEHNYRYTFKKWGRNDTVDYKFASFDAKHVAQIKKKVNYNDPKVLMGNSLTFLRFFDPTYPSCLTDDTKGLLFDLNEVWKILPDVENGVLTSDDLQKLRSLSIPFYAEIVEAMMRKNEEAMKNLSEKSILNETPKVSEEALFDAIISKHKGKVILVDFWNTWCGPCRSAIKMNEPLKSGELKSDNIVWIYLANETSPKATYLSFITKIEGQHYRLNSEQWKHLCQRFNVTGIPSYVLVNKDGTAKSREDFRDHSIMKKTLLELIK